MFRRGLALGAVVVMCWLATACDSGSSSGSAASSSPPPAVDASTSEAACKAGQDTQTALKGVSQQTDTTSESVSKLDSVQSEWGDAASAANTAVSAKLMTDKTLAHKFIALQTDIGHLKVDLSNGSDMSADVSQLTSDVDSLPKFNC